MTDLNTTLTSQGNLGLWDSPKVSPDELHIHGVKGRPAASTDRGGGGVGGSRGGVGGVGGWNGSHADAGLPKLEQIFLPLFSDPP